MQIFVMVDYTRKMTGKKSCKCGEYGSLEHFLSKFFFYIFFYRIVIDCLRDIRMFSIDN